MQKRIRLQSCLIDHLIFIWVVGLLLLFFHQWVPVLFVHDPLLLSVLTGSWYFLYFFISELFYSRTPGKFLMHVKVIDLDGSLPHPSQIFVRSLCGLVPLDSVSFLLANTGWHDQLSRTMVVVG